jgi:hypothetical protein
MNTDDYAAPVGQLISFAFLTQVGGKLLGEFELRELVVGMFSADRLRRSQAPWRWSTAKDSRH